MSVNVALDQLKNFVAVGEELHFTRAAEKRLHVSQPWLSRSVRSLEEKLGVQLFNRDSRHVELTEPGRRLLYGARKLIHEFDRTVSCVVRNRKGNGHLTVGYSPYVDLRFMTELKETSLPGTYPVLISFESSSCDETVFRVRSREWDCGIVVLPVDAQSLEIISLFRLPLAAAMPKTHRLARKRALQLADLEGERLILEATQHQKHFREWLLRRLSEAGVAPKEVADAASPHEAQYVVTRGAGIALANSGAFRTTLDAVVVRTFPSQLVETAMVLRKGRRSPLAETFADKVIQLAKIRAGNRQGMRSVA